ncbi:site-specific DNA-methyltransferase [Burkholderia sp. Ac-20365]|uniref:site-specific DNA-methyltransferase n=1 Tax=Burkholderia sp. Ac-20365 TaxID=2703897 RepID=UPI00197BE620|nr:site-specific DNA-methyltransferase [Burkholderia sp. Ac-20365]MBN3760909.1 site-specific DNA-methyltransferase [Burkholderia sp. Ac-20365]
MNASAQLDLFAQVASAYAEAPGMVMSNDALYDSLMRRMGVSREVAEKREAVGASGQRHSLWKRRVRFVQQSLKHMGILQRDGASRGIWSLTEAAGKRLHRAGKGVRLVAFSTELGVCLFASNNEGLRGLDEPISLILTSPPFPLRKQRDYGNVDQKAYVEWLVRVLEPIVKHLAPGGCVALQLSPAIHVEGSPERSLYQERLLIALHDELGLKRITSIPWVNYSKPPAPMQWALKRGIQLASAHEFIHVLTNDPLSCKADNRRVLLAHSERHKALMASGGEKREAVYGDGAYVLRRGAFGRETAGKIPRDVIEMGHRCADTLALRKAANALNLPTHGAVFPTKLPSFLIQYLTEPDALVVDPFGGWCKTALAAERLGRRWVMTELVLEYARVAAEAFRGFSGFSMNPLLEQVGNAA